VVVCTRLLWSGRTRTGGAVFVMTNAASKGKDHRLQTERRWNSLRCRSVYSRRKGQRRYSGSITILGLAHVESRIIRFYLLRIPGSGTVSLFFLGPPCLVTLVDKAPSGGAEPVAVCPMEQSGLRSQRGWSRKRGCVSLRRKQLKSRLDINRIPDRKHHRR